MLFRSKYNVRDTVLLSGWLFADLLLGLAVIFLVSLPGAQQPPAPPAPIVKWTVSPTDLSPDSSQCSGGTNEPQCTIMLSETSDSQTNLNWTASSDMSGGHANDTVVFTPANGVLEPGQSVEIKISVFPCQNSSFTLTSPKIAKPLIVLWHCSRPDRLDFKYKTFNLTVHDIPGLLAGSASAKNDIEQQVRRVGFLQQGSVGLAVVYGGTPDDGGIGQAQAIAQKVYAILADLGQRGFAFQRSSYYVPLYTLGSAPSQVTVDTYLFQT